MYGDDFKEKELIEQFENDCIDCLLVEDGSTSTMWPFPTRVIHDGYKVGTTSWVFMGRKDSKILELDHYAGGKVYCIRREIPANIAKKLNVIHPELDNSVYAAYSLDQRINLDVGPCLTLDEVIMACGGNPSVKIKTVWI